MSTIIHAVVGYFVLLLVVRVLKRRAGAQTTMFEFVLIFLIGGTIILSTLGNDRSVTNATCAVISVGFIHRLLGWGKSKSSRLGALIDGVPLVAIKKGAWQHEVLREIFLRREDIEAAARGKGLATLRGVDYAVIERDGQISILMKASEAHGDSAAKPEH
jgi:uncharacterized membrane protein YcaP (DUF421 family)